MEFDKQRIFTPLNAGGVKIGSIGYVSDYYEYLETYVKEGTPNLRFGTLVYNNGKFQVKNGNKKYQLFYLVEEPKEPRKRPCTREELLAMLRKQGLPMLSYISNGFTYTIVRLNDIGITVISVTGSHLTYNYLELCETFTLLDETPLWVEE